MNEGIEVKTRFASALVWLASLALATGLMAGWGLLVYGSAFALPSMAMGTVVMAHPKLQVLGTIVAGQDYDAAFSLMNLTSEPIVVTGMYAPCTCVSVDELPMKLLPRESRTLRNYLETALD